MNFKAWRDRLLQPVRELYERLTPSQRVSLAVLAGVVALSMSVLVFTAPGSTLVTLAGSELTADFKTFLETEGIDYELNAKGEVRIPAEDQRRLVAVSFEQGLDKKDDVSFFDWLFQAPSLQQTARQFDQKLFESQERELQRTLADFTGVVSASVQAQRSKSSGVWRSPSDLASVAVHLVLEPDYKLPKKSARVIGRFVSRFLNVPISRVELTDQHITDYKINAADGYVDDGDEKARESNMESKIEELLAAEFSHQEFRITVDFTTSYNQATREELKVNPENVANVVTSEFEDKSTRIHPALSAPGVKPNVANSSLGGSTTNGSGTATENHERSERRFEAEIGHTLTKTSIPAGQPEEVSITVKLAEDAILRQIKEDKATFEEQEDYKPTRQDLSEYLAMKEKEVRNVSSMSPEKVRTHVVSFKPRPVPVATAAETGFLTFAQNNVRELCLVFLACMACFLLYRITARSIPAMESLPDPVEDLKKFLEQKDERDRLAREEAEVAAAEALALQQQEQPVVEDEASKEEALANALLESLSEFIDGNPEDTATLLKLWLSDPAAVLTGEPQGAERRKS